MESEPEPEFESESVLISPDSSTLFISSYKKMSILGQGIQYLLRHLRFESESEPDLESDSGLKSLKSSTHNVPASCIEKK